jgi:hypothetical protein
MQSLIKTSSWVAVAIAVTGAAASPMSRVSVSFPTAPVTKATVAKTVTAAAAVAAITPATTAIKLATAPVAKKVSIPTFAADDSLRSQLKFETVKWAGKPIQTLDEASRVRLAKAAAEKAGLHEVGLSYHDVYGIIEAETSWIPRTGASKDGTANLGLTQFEPRTAQGMGITDPGDPIQAVFGAAMYMKTGAKWASNKLAGLKLTPEEHAAKVREGVSVHYNLSIKGRNKWDGRNTETLPIETQRHIRNARAGAQEAAQLSKLLRT